ALAWNARNELQAVTPVVRDGDRDDRESYRYGAQSQRVLKVSVQKTGSGVQTRRVVYLPGLELRSTHRGDAETERLQVMTAGEAGRAQVRVLHWTSGRPDGISNDQVRYSHDNLTGSSGLEVDGDGRVISMEEYYPYGGTAILTARSAAEADYRTLRYSGKERDATGLYYYGYRYCQPWSGRWLSADPAGTVDGLNLFRMCRNNPVTLKDEDGRFSTLKMPLDIFIHDVENLRATTSSTEFHELFLNNQGGLEVSELYSSPGLTPSPVADDTRPYNQDVESAFVIFQDNSGKARLFVNPEEEHMAINPDMGMPIFAGRLQRLAGDKGYRITNESGHYKTPANTDVLSMLRSANPDANLSNFKYEPYDFGEVDRMDDIFATPGEFRRKVDEYRLNKKSFHAFLMEVGRERIKKTGPYGMMVYRKMFTKTTETQTDEPSFVQWAAKDAGWVFPEHYLDYNPVRMSKYFDNLYNGNVTVKKSFLGKKKEKIRGPHFSPFNH
ncbi:RHS repeat-associated core domain-containing protein, partial [Enterobacter genomosp. O]|uniref:RHS repeat-associated core domain-containing protein n=1 Tax=Enterobacter genomosp. O TaxID=2364150 RepID=UPI000A575A44